MGRTLGGAIEPGTITDADFSNDTSKNLTGAKQRHVYRGWTNFDLAIAGTPVTREEIVFCAKQAGTIRGFRCVLNDSGTSTSITFDLKKNGTTILTGVATIVHGTGDRIFVNGTLASDTFVADDVFSIAMTVSSSTGAQGPYAEAFFEENLAP